MITDVMKDLLAEAIRTAVELVEANRGFQPFAVVKSVDGEVSQVQAAPAGKGTAGLIEEEAIDATDAARLSYQDPSPGATTLIQGLRAAAQRGEIVTAAVVFDTYFDDRLSGGRREAIRVQLEDCEAKPVTCYAPYSWIGGRVETDEIAMKAGQAAVFGGELRSPESRG